MKSGMDLINEAKQRITEVTPQQVRERKAGGESMVLLDVREPNEWNLGRVPGAIHIPRGTMETAIEARVPRDATVVIYCASGNRSALAAETMTQMGYKNVASLDTGFRGWAESGGEIDD